MALIKCTDCGNQISDLAPACPFCGRPASGQPRPSSSVAPPPLPSPKAGPSSWLGKFVVLIGLIVLFIMIRGCDDASVPASVPAQPLVSSDTSTSAEPVVATGPNAQTIQNWLDVAASASEATAYRIASANNLINQASGSAEAEAAKKLLPELLKAQEDERSRGNWYYSASDDPMSGRKTFTARLESDNTLNFDFPYQGAQHGTLTLRRHPKWGNDVILSIEKGQILCHSFSSCPISVRFDEAAATTYSGTEPSDNSSDTAFIPAYSKFSEKMKTAKRVRIQFNVYQEGAVVLDFNVKGFDSSKMK